MNAWWQARQPRERVLLTVMTIALVGAVIWWSLLAPLTERGQQLRAQRAAAAADVAWMREAAARLAAAGPTAAAADAAAAGLDPLVAAQQAAGTAEIPATAVRLTVGQDGRLEASFSAVPFSALLHWTELMTERTGLQLNAFSARAAAPGLVEANVALTGASD